ncbi:MAG: hypothetical protein ACYC6V_02445 [Bacillota bacterium]
MFNDEGSRPGGELFTTRPPVAGPSVPGDQDSLVDVDSPDDFGMEEGKPPAKPTTVHEGKEYWPQPLRGKGAPR